MAATNTTKERLVALKHWRDSGIQGSRQSKITDYQLKRIADSGAVDTDGVMSAASGDRSLVQTFAPQIVTVLQACAAMGNEPAQAGLTARPPQSHPPR